MRVATALLLAAGLAPRPALAENNAACVSSYEQGQLSRRDAHFDAARSAFAVCTADSCPSVVRERCLQFARDLEAAQPTVIVVIHDALSADVPSARVSIDGAPAVPVPPTALRLDPGEHLLHVDSDAGSAELKIVLREMEKDRRLDMTVVKPAPPHDVAPPRDATPPRIEPRHPPIAAWGMLTFAGVTLAGAGASSAAGWVLYANLGSTCQHACTDDQVMPLRILWPAAFVALGVGVVAFVVAGVLFATHGHGRRERAIRVGPAGVSGSF